ncbi:MAG: L-2-amino-thiazoline-4-carboxylic acid hydrolase [Candidatus Heimdallarchaeota archaeon]|nr:L-2-amino-thiazoline-4-carboxylic acid hydrolase [Candidatus Heimdallarchaeota archaeon]
MEFEQYGKEVENLEINYNPFSFAESNLFKQLTNIYGFIKENKPEIYEELIEKVTAKIENIPKKDYFSDKSEKVIERIVQSNLLLENQELVLSHLNIFIDTQGITDVEYWQNKDIKIPARNFMQSANDLYYTYLNSLVEIIGKENTIELYKKMIRNYVEKFDKNQKNIAKDLEDMRLTAIRWAENNPYGRVRLISTIENGRFIQICKNCEKVQTLDNFDELDKDLLYVECCYCHIPLAEMWNENLVLTLEETIAKGDSFCAYVFHDKSIVDKIEHPPREFFEKVLSEYKWK